MCSGGDGGGQPQAQAAAPAPPVPAAAAPLSAPQIPNAAGGNNPNSPGYRGFDTPTNVRTVRKQGGGSGSNVSLPGGSGLGM